MASIGVVGVLVMCGAVLGGVPAFAQGDAEAGKNVFRRCAVCHATEAGKTKVGPSLDGLFGRKAGTVPGFRYSGAMKESGIVWTEATLDRYLAAPREVVPGNRMPFPGLKDAKARADVIAYLKKVLDQR